MKLVISIRAEIPVDYLEDYEASSIEEAAKTMKKWLEDGTSWLGDFVDNMEVLDVKGIS